MQFKRLATLSFCLAIGCSPAWAQATTNLIPMDEPVAVLASPASANPAIPAFQYNFGSQPLASFVTATPLLCGNTAAPAAGSSAVGINSTYYSANGAVGASPLPFVFGASSISPAVSAVAYGATNVQYNGNQLQFGGDPLDALVCYGLTSSDGVTFVHKVTRDLFADDFEVSGTSGILGNSTVALNVIQLPNAGNGNYYIYTIDVTIPALPAGTNCSTLDCNFALVEGYDTSVLDPASGQWCLAQTGNPTTCGPGGGGTLPSSGDININYSNYSSTGISLAAPIAPAAAKVLHFYVYRKLVSGASVPSSGAPVAVAALFSPIDLEENKLDDNVATGNNTLANVAPSVSTDTAFTNAAASLQEDTDSGTFMFSISDPDSSEAPGQLLTASVTLNLPGGIQVPIDAQNCNSGSTNYQSAPVNRTCSFTLHLHSQPGAWNASVGTLYQGQFNDVATDIADGSYAPGVSASIQIVATDAQGKNSTAFSTPVHIFSKTNNPPVVTFINATQWVPATDPNDNNSYPTFTCSVSAGINSGGCGAPNQYNSSLIAIDFSNASVLTAVPGPAAAFDELASQTTLANNYTGIDGGNVDCTNEQAADIFAPSTQTYGGGGPLVSMASGIGTASVSYTMNFAIPSAAPEATVSALCSLTNTISDAMQGSASFPPSEVATPAAQAFRIVVNP